MTRRREPACRVCGCTKHNACDDGLGGGCSWVKVEPESTPLCSACEGKIGDAIEALGRSLALQRKYGADNTGREVAVILRAALKRLRIRLARQNLNPDPAWGNR